MPMPSGSATGRPCSDDAPAELRRKALQQRPHAALALVRERPQVAVGVAELLVLGADPPVGLGFAAGLEERDQLAAVGDRLTLGFRWRRHAEPPSDGATGPSPCPRSADRALDVSLPQLSSLRVTRPRAGESAGTRSYAPLTAAAPLSRLWQRCGGGEGVLTSHRIAVLPGDGIGQEVIAAGVEVLHALAAREPGLDIEMQTFDWGSAWYRAHGRMMPDDGLDQLRGFDAIYFGAVGAPDIPDDVTLWGLRLAICQGFDQYANVRPARLLPGVRSPLRGIRPGDLDWIVVRENTEGEYAGAGGRVHPGVPVEGGTELAIFTRAGCARIMRFAFEIARARPKRQLTLVTKSNAQRHGMVLWDETFAEVARDFPDVRTDKELVDAMTTRMVLKPKSLDVVIATNL